MPTILERTCALPSPTLQSPTLRAVLEELGITPFTPENVTYAKLHFGGTPIRTLFMRRRLAGV